MKSFFMRHWWLWTVVIFSVPPIMFSWFLSNHQEEGLIVEVDSGLVDSYPAFDRTDSLWMILDSMERQMAEAWKMDSVKGPEKFKDIRPFGMGYALESIHPGMSMYAWVSSLAGDVPTSNAYISMASKLSDLGNVYETSRKSSELEVIFSVAYDSKAMKKTVEILHSTEPDSSFEKDLKKQLERTKFFSKEPVPSKTGRDVEKDIDKLLKDLLQGGIVKKDTFAISQEDSLKTYFRFVAKVAFFKVQTNIRICRDAPENGTMRPFCDVTVNDSLYHCFRIEYLTYGNRTVAFRCEDGTKSFEESAKDPWDFDLLYDAPYDELKKLWLERGLDVPGGSNMKPLEILKHHI